MLLQLVLALFSVWGVHSTPLSIDTALIAFPQMASTSNTVDGKTLLSQKKSSLLARKVWASNHQVDFSALFSKNYINHQIPSVVGHPLTESRQVWQNLVDHFHQSFSDVEEKVLFQIAENEFVATQWQTTGTHTGEYLSYPATGKRVSWSGIQIDQFDQGKIVESWVVWDMYSLFSQLGFVKLVESQ